MILSTRNLRCSPCLVRVTNVWSIHAKSIQKYLGAIYDLLRIVFHLLCTDDMVVYWNRIEKEVVTEVVSFKKFRLISEEATSGTPFVQKEGL